MKKVILILLLATVVNSYLATAQDKKNKKFFVGYETLEMSMNKFQNFAGEFGYRVDPKNQVRLFVGEVKLTERHLSSKYEAVAVDGNNVEGYFRIYELYYDRYFDKNRNWYYSGSMGFVNDKYKHLISDKKIDNSTITAGFAIGYKKIGLFKLKHLYINASMPFRYYFNSIPEQQWGETKVLTHKFVNNIWLLVGYSF